MWCSRPPSMAAVYAKHGTTIDTRLTVIDKQPADERMQIPSVAGDGA